MRRRKHFITLVCLVVGMLVLTTAVYANYDDAKGYTNYKNALKRLAFEENNFSAEYNSKITIDGKDIMSAQAKYKCADGNNSQYSKTEDLLKDKNNVYEYYSYVTGENTYNYYVDTNEYYQGKASKNQTGSLIPMDDATSKKAVRFAELLTDAIVGDLKNNVVLESTENGIKNYSIQVSGNQIPEIVNAGLSLMFTAGNNVQNTDNYENEITAKFGNDPYIDNVNMKVSLDEKGRLVGNKIEASLAGVDKSGMKHTAVLKVDGKVYDYGKSKADTFNPEGKKAIQ